MTKPEAGWRYFSCSDGCAFIWRAACRDYGTPSGEECPNCGEFCRPYFALADPMLPVDEYGNLRADQIEAIDPPAS